MEGKKKKTKSSSIVLLKFVTDRAFINSRELLSFTRQKKTPSKQLHRAQV